MLCVWVCGGMGVFKLYIHVRIYMYVYMYMCVCGCVCIHTYTYTYICIYNRAPTMQTAFAARVRRVVSFLRLRGLPKDLRRDIQRFYESEWASTGGNTFSQFLFIVTLQGQYLGL
jgi:hypothetical protein